jgi:ribonucleotide monophosphatase NagD (HAD superfamily)
MLPTPTSPHTLTHSPTFKGFDYPAEEANAVLLADMDTELNYTKLNTAFQVLQREGTTLVALNRCRYYRDVRGELSLDVGPFAHMLEWATNKEATIAGKPSPAFFHEALSQIDRAAHQTGRLRVSVCCVVDQTGWCVNLQ